MMISWTKFSLLVMMMNIIMISDYITFHFLYMPYYRRRTGRKYRVKRTRTYSRRTRRSSSTRAYLKGTDVFHY